MSFKACKNKSSTRKDERKLPTIISQYAAPRDPVNNERGMRVTNLQVRVTRKEYTKHVPYLPLIPVSTPEERDNAGYRVRFAGIGLYANPASVFDTKQVVYNLETLLPLWEVYCGDIDNTLELALGVISQKGENGN